MIFALKHLVQRMTGGGPLTVRPFDELWTPTGPGNAVHRPESFAGELAREPADHCQYTPGHSLLGQTPRPEIVAGRPRYQSAGIAVAEIRRLFTLSDAAVAGDDAVVYCPRRRLAVAETVRQWDRPAHRHPLLAAPRFPRAQPLPGLTLSLGTLGGGGFYHFLLEALPRLQLARPWLARVDHVLANGSPGSFQERWLVHAGVTAAKIRWLQGHSHYRCEQLLFANAPCPDSQPTPWIVSRVRAAVAAGTAPRATASHLWITRRDATSRHLAWEDELLRALGDFEHVALAELTPAEQIARLAGASVVAGLHGAGFSNLVFCTPGTRVIELMPDLRHSPLYSRLAAAAGCRHAWAAVDVTQAPPALPDLVAAIRAFLA